jgi:tripartite-type tricarboxylate transporter receptor subunit TctC
MVTRRVFLKCGLAAGVAGLLPRTARAAWRPDRPIHLVVGFAPGGGTDVTARALANAAQDLFPVQIVVVNKPGAAGVIAAQQVARAPADGYQILVGGGSESTSVGNHQQIPYDPRKDFRAVIMMQRSPIHLFVRADSPHKHLGDLVTHAKINPGKVTFASSGVGGLYHSTQLVLARKAEITVNHVPYQGGAPSMQAVLAGEVEVGLGAPEEIKGQLDAGQIRVLAVASKERTPGYESVPTLRELGFDVFIENMKGLNAPAGLPDDIYGYLHDGFKQAIESETWKTQAARVGILTEYLDGPAYQQRITDMYNTIGEALKASQ